jgi:hypothetical protein
MNNSIKTFFIALLSLSLSTSFAQSVIIKGGVNIADMRFKDNNINANKDNETKLGVNIGALIDLPITQVISFETGLAISSKGANFDGSYYTGKIELLYIDIPVSAKINIKINSKASFFIAPGLYLGIGTSGKFTTQYDNWNQDIDESVKWGSEKGSDDFKRIDLGGQVSAGLEYNSIILAVAFGQSLVNHSPEEDDDFQAINKVITITLGLRLSKK